MIPTDRRNRIYASVPDHLLYDGVRYSAARSYSDNADVQTLLQAHPIVVTLRYSADRPAPDWTPATRLLAATAAEDAVTYTHGQWRHTTLTIDVHARDTDTAAKADLIDGYMDGLQLWVLRDLPEIISVAEDLGALDLSYLEPDIARREAAWTLRYLQSYTLQTPALQQIDGPDLIL